MGTVIPLYREGFWVDIVELLAVDELYPVPVRIEPRGHILVYSSPHAQFHSFLALNPTVMVMIVALDHIAD